MGTLSLTLPDGRSGTLDVDDGFASLSPADQQDFIAHVHSQLASNPAFGSSRQASPQGGPSGSFDVGGALAAGHSMADIANEVGSRAGFDVAGARQAGYTDQQIVHEMAARGVASLPSSLQSQQGGQQSYSQPNQSYADDFWAGAHGAISGLGQTATDLGTVARDTLGDGMVSRGLNDAGTWLTGHAPSVPANYRSPDVGNALRNGSWGDVASQVAHAAVAGTPDMLATLGAGAIAGPVGAGAYQSVRNLGPIADQRAMNNGHAQATSGDVLGALPGAAADALAGSVIPGGAAENIASPILRGVARAGIDAGAGAFLDQSNQIAGSVGTNTGLQDDPMQSVGAGLGAGLTRAVTLTPGLAKAGIKSGADSAMSRTLDAPASPEDAQSVVRLNSMMDQAQQDAVNTTGKRLNDTTLANNVKNQLQTNLNLTVKSLRQGGQISPEDATALSDVINNEARRQNNTITAASLGLLAGMDLPDATRTTLANSIADLNNISSQSFMKNETGPFQMVGKTLGQAGMVVHGLSMGNPMGVAEAVLGGGVGTKIGGGLGSVADRFLGTNTPTIRLQLLNARRYLNSMGIAPDGTSQIPDLQTIRNGIQPPSGPTVEEQAQAALDKRSRQNAVKLAMADQVPTTDNSIPSDASNAAVASAVQNAQQIMARSGMLTPDSRDKLSVGNPVGATPINGAQPLQRASQTPLASPGMSPSAQPLQPAQTPSQAPQRAPWRTYVANGAPGATDAHIDQAIQNLTNRGAMTQQFANDLRNHPGGVNGPVLQPIQAETLRVMGAPQGAPQVGNQGFAVEHSVQARINANQYQENVRALAAQRPDLADAIIDIGQQKTPSAKLAKAAQYISKNPAAADVLTADWLVNHGRRS